jgi:outer membrane receptor protein involved in Fe transport
MRRLTRRVRIASSLLLSGSALFAAGPARAQTALPEIVVNQPAQAPKPAQRRAAVRPQAPAAPAEQMTPVETAETAAVRAVAERNQSLNEKRDNLLTKVGANAHEMNREAIEALPQATNTPLDKVLLQAPGVTQDSAPSGSLHVRNEHANVQYRINGILLPEGVAGFGQILETAFIGKMELITGALPAQYGLHTAGLVDITTKPGAQLAGGSVSVYGGSRETFTPSFEYGGISGKTEYFFTGRYFTSNEGIENPTPSLNPIHDRTHQAKFFGYASTLLDDNTRLSFITGASVIKFLIPDNPGQMPSYIDFTGFTPSAANSSLLNERQWERNFYNVAALQKSVGNVDWQLAAFSRYSTVHFVPDPIGDIVFNGVASDVFRRSFLNGVQGDAAYRVNDAHTLRTGFLMTGEQTQVVNSSLVLQATAACPPLFELAGTADCSGETPFPVVDSNSKLGWLVGVYVQDEWRLTDRLTLNAGLRFDQMYQFVDANQFSPRASVTYQATGDTKFHAGYARYFTPPLQVIATPANVGLFANTTAAAAVGPPYGPVLPERSHLFDAGVDHKLLPGLTVGVDVYYKIAKDLLDDGQFGQAYVLSGFNYAKGFNEGIELKLKYENGNFRAYGNMAWARQMGTQIVSNQYLFGPDEIAYIATHWIYTDHSQFRTGSAGVSYLWQGTRYSIDMIYGSGLRSGDFNLSHVPAYTQFNLGISHEFASPTGGKPFTLRFDVVNLFDKIYEIRDGSGIGVFAPQFGPRRGYFVGLSQKL